MLMELAETHVVALKISEDYPQTQGGIGVNGFAVDLGHCKIGCCRGRRGLFPWLRTLLDEEVNNIQAVSLKREVKCSLATVKSHI
jgi:hypothetical protein